MSGKKITDDPALSEDEMLGEAGKIYYCQCGALPSPTLMGGLICRTCGHYHPNYDKWNLTQDPEPA